MKQNMEIENTNPEQEKEDPLNLSRDIPESAEETASRDPAPDGIPALKESPKKFRRRPVRRAKRILMCLLCVIPIVAAVLTMQNNRAETTVQSYDVYTSDITVDSTYQVNLLPNTLYTERFLPEGFAYSGLLTDDIEFRLTAEYKGTVASDISGEYEVYVSIAGVQSLGSNAIIIYEQQLPLVGPRTLSAIGEQSLLIEETVSVIPSGLLKLADEADLALGAKVGRVIKLVFKGSFAADTAYGEINREFLYELPLPTVTGIYSIAKPAQIALHEAIQQTEEITISPEKRPMILLAGFIAAAVAILAGVLLLTRRPTEEEDYLIQVRSIKRKYESRMVALVALPTMQNKAVLAVAGVEDLIKLADETERPVCYVAGENGAPQDDMLFITEDETFFVHKLR